MIFPCTRAKMSGGFQNSEDKLRKLIIYVGYFNLVAATVNVVGHTIIHIYITGGFQCDASIEKWPILEPVLFFINLGTCSYPLPLIFSVMLNDSMLSNKRTCYFGMIHVHPFDVMNGCFGLIWLKFVIYFVKAIYKKNVSTMWAFICLSLLKIQLQLYYFTYQSATLEAVMPMDVYMIFRVIDICIAGWYLIFLSYYIRSLISNTTSISQSTLHNKESPPTYVECTITPNEKEPDASTNTYSCQVTVT